MFIIFWGALKRGFSDHGSGEPKIAIRVLQSIMELLKIDTIRVCIIIC